MFSIVDSVHPDYMFEDLTKWRLTYEGGRRFIDRYLYPLSSRESSDDLTIRRQIAYCPSFAKAAVNDIKNAIYQRITDIDRKGGPQSYQDAVTTVVNLEGTDMNTFIGTEILPELLVMKRVGVLTDMPGDLGQTLLDRGTKRPFLGIYQSENIKGWTYACDNNEKYLTNILLCELVSVSDSYGFTVQVQERYRSMKLIEGGVEVKFWKKNPDAGKQDQPAYMEDYTVILNLPRIPFTIFEIPQSLLSDVADYQIALLNLESTDISFLRKANFPTYYEFYDPKWDQPYKKPTGPPGASDGTNTIQNTSKEREAKVGLSRGRRFPIGTEAPGFISPSPGTLTASIEKGKQLRDDIYKLVNLTVSNLSSSADSKKVDQSPLENGLSFIGQVLQKGEIDIGRHWTNFEGGTKNPEIKYPDTYSLETPEQRQARVKSLSDMSNKIPSKTYRQAVAKKIAYLTIGCSLTEAQMETIKKEIDTADTLTSDPDQIIAAHKEGLVSDDVASIALGYPKGDVEQAKKDRAERIKLTLEAQGGPQGNGAARGATDFGGGTSTGEKIGKPQRGAGTKVGND